MAGRKQRKPTLTLPSQFPDPPSGCLSRCQFEPHANLLTRFAATGNLELLKHGVSVCSNPWNIRDSAGRNVLMVAASCGCIDIVLWLLRKKGRVKVESVDLESRWSALHRAAYLGHVGALFPLVRSGGNLEQLDYDKLSTLNILHYNMNTIEKTKLSQSSYLYVWGTNSNMTLGHDHIRSSPELLDIPNHHGNIKQAIICKFHSVFLTEGGGVYTCGHGQGGRLGHGNDKTCLALKFVQALKSEKCVAVAAARDHTVFLTDNGVVYTCGLNDAHQLGQTPKTPGPFLPHSLAPYHLRSLKGVVISSIGAGRYHTAMCTETEVYTCGRNLGQLGYGKSTDSQVQPKMVTGIHIDSGDSIDHFSVSDAATACITKRKRIIYVCAKYTVLRCERLAIPETLSISQFLICASLGDLNSKQSKKKGQSAVGVASDTSSGSGLSIGITDSSNQLWMAHWVDFSKKSCVSPQLVPGSTKRNVVHFNITKHLTVVTPQGEVFTGPLSLPKLPSLTTLKRVPCIQQVHRVFTDYKTNNMAVIQHIYSPPYLPILDKSTFNSDIYSLLSESSLPGSVNDVTFEVAGTRLTAHKLILCSQSRLLSSLFTSSPSPSPSPSLPKLITSFDTQQSMLSLSFTSPQIFQLFLCYLYGGQLTVKSHNQPIKDVVSKSDSPPSTSNSKASLDESTDDWNSLYDAYADDKSNSFDIFRSFDDELVPFGGSKDAVVRKKLKSSPVDSDNKGGNDMNTVYETDRIKEDLGLLKTLAVTFKVDGLVKRVDSLLSSRSKPHSCTIRGPQVTLVRESAPHDVTIVSLTTNTHSCHKCVLVARSDYFQSMLLMGWRETKSEDAILTLNLPMSDPLIEMMLDYLYTDRAPMVQESSSLEWLTSALTTADQLLLKGLKTMCELSLAKILTLDNVGFIIDLSEVYNAQQLHTSCIQFVCLNLPALLEMGGVDGLTPPTLEAISNAYREMFPKVAKRRGLTLNEPGVDDIPSSYLSNETIESSDNDEDDELSWKQTGMTTPTAKSKSSSFDTPTSGSKTTPTSSARKKRRRKGSGIKTEPRQLFSPVITEELTDNKTTEQCTESELAPVVEGTCEVVDIDKMAADVNTDNSIKTDIDLTNSTSTCVNGGGVSVVVAMDTCHNGDSRTVSEDVPVVEGKGGGTPRGTCPWGGRNDSSSENISEVKSMREIMEGEETRSKAQHSSTLPSRKKKRDKRQSQPMDITTVRSLSIPDEQERETCIIMRSMSVPTTTTGHSPTSPWGVDTKPSPGQSSVSLKALMAEEEAQERTKLVAMETHTRCHGDVKPPAPIRRERRTSFPPPMSTGAPVVSFSDIVTHQQHELDLHLHKQSHKKPFQLIQIEEEAIHGLLALYNASDSPQEYVTVERVSGGAVRSTQTQSSRRTSAPYTGHKSAWGVKKQFT